MQLLVSETRVLTPAEYEELRSQLSPDHRLLFDGLIFTGMRATEFERFLEHPEWYDPNRQYIGLPKGASLKVKARVRARPILLSSFGNRAMRDLIDNVRRAKVHFASRQSWRNNLSRAAEKAGLEPEGIVPKMTRKTWVSWLMASYPQCAMQISFSMGHDLRTMQEHYLNLPFSKKEIEEIRPYVQGWGNFDL
jgi:integrase